MSGDTQPDVSIDTLLEFSYESWNHIIYFSSIYWFILFDLGSSKNQVYYMKDKVFVDSIIKYYIEFLIWESRLMVNLNISSICNFCGLNVDEFYSKDKRNLDRICMNKHGDTFGWNFARCKISFYSLAPSRLIFIIYIL